MDEKPRGKRSVAVALFFMFLCLLMTFCFQMKAEKILCELATVPMYASALEQELPTASSLATSNAETTVPSSAVTQPSVSQIQITESVQQIQKASTEKATTARPQTEKNTEISPILIVNTNTKKIHSPDCSYAQNIKAENRAQIQKDELPAYEEKGYALCGHCKGCAK